MLMRHARASHELLLAACLMLASCALGPAPIARGPSAPIAAEPEDPCDNLRPGEGTNPAPISLELLAIEARKLESAALTSEPLELGKIKPLVVVGRTRFHGVALPQVILAKPRFPLERADEFLPKDVLPVVDAQRDARAALARVSAMRGQSMRAAACFDQRRVDLEVTSLVLRDKLSDRGEPLADLLMAERALDESGTLEDPHLADVLLAEATTRATRAREATRPDDLVGFFARALRVEALRRAGEEDAALVEANELIGVTPPAPSLSGEAELRAAEMEPDEAKRAALYVAAVAAASDNPRLRYAARAGAIRVLQEADPDAALRLTGELVSDLPPDFMVDVDDFAAHAYAVLLPRRPAWWREPLPWLSPEGVQIVAVALAEESDIRGNHGLARTLRTRALSLPAVGPVTEALQRKLRDAPLPISIVDEARMRVTQLRSECSAEMPPRVGDVELTRDARGLAIGAHKDDKAFVDCLQRWGPDYLLGLPPLRATLSR